MFVVTGACGFIGSNMVTYLNKLGIYDIIVIDDFCKVSLRNLETNQFSYIHNISICDSDILPNCDIRGVFHFGAISNTLEKDKQKLNYYNVQYTNILNKVCKKREIPIVFSSTAAIYGNGNGPLNLYAESKLECEQNIKDDAVCFRLFNVYGPNEQHKGRMASVIHKWFVELEETGVIKIFENSQNYKRDFIFVEDVCDAFYKAIQNYVPGVYDLGSGVDISFEEVADLIISLYGRGKKEYIKMPDDLKNQYQTHTIAKNNILNQNTITKSGVKRLI